MSPQVRGAATESEAPGTAGGQGAADAPEAAGGPGTADAPGAAGEELVVLLDEQGRPTGTAPKASVHHRDTPLHLAFSCYGFDDRGRLLLTRRAAHKRTWPGVWTNTVCGHPGPGEELPDAVRRRALDELGLLVDEVRPVLPDFRYRAVMADGTVENEVCPVFVTRVETTIDADPDEVGELDWVEWADFRADVLGGRRAVSPWCLEQLEQLPEDLPRLVSPAS